MSDTRRCSQCRREKGVDEFYRDAKGRDGRQAACKPCHNARVRRYRERLRERNRDRPWTVAAKRCGRCDRTRPATAFHRNRSTTDGLHWVCRDCNRDPTSRRPIERRRTIRDYDLTRLEYDAMVGAQGNRCAVCRRAFTQTPHIDHDHETGAVRGLLCRSCNVGLGMFEDRPDLLLSAVEYLHSPPGVPGSQEARDRA